MDAMQCDATTNQQQPAAPASWGKPAPAQAAQTQADGATNHTPMIPPDLYAMARADLSSLTRAAQQRRPCRNLHITGCPRTARRLGPYCSNCEQSRKRRRATALLQWRRERERIFEEARMLEQAFKVSVEALAQDHVTTDWSTVRTLDEALGDENSN